jgi:hypothetical protein
MKCTNLDRATPACNDMSIEQESVGMANNTGYTSDCRLVYSSMVGRQARQVREKLRRVKSEY